MEEDVASTVGGGYPHAGVDSLAMSFARTGSVTAFAQRSGSGLSTHPPPPHASTASGTLTVSGSSSRAVQVGGLKGEGFMGLWHPPAASAREHGVRHADGLRLLLSGCADERF